MRNILLFYLKVSLFLLIIFFTFRFFFFLSVYENLKNESIYNQFLAFVIGIKLDFSFIGYVLTLINLISIILVLFKQNELITLTNKAIIIFTTFLVSSISIGDIFLYKYWKSKLDWNAITYLSNLQSIFNSISILEFYTYFILVSLCIVIAYWVYKKLIHVERFNIKRKKLYLLVLLFPFIFLAVRGGIDLKPIQLGIPINVSSVYYHSNNYLNHTAYNPTWNFLQGMTFIKQEKFDYYSDGYDKKTYNKYFANNTKDLKNNKIINSKNPNIIIIIVESFSANAIEVLEGKPNLTPYFTQLCNEGILFNNFFATGTRSEMGLVSLFSGTPSFPNKSIAKDISNFDKLPFLFEKLKEKNYSNYFYHGGDLDFCNLRAYFKSSKIDSIIERKDFSRDSYLSKWGVPDHLLFKKIINDLETIKLKSSPFCITTFTLSSHEPFDFPDNHTSELKTTDEKYIESIKYTDKSIGEFIYKLKECKLWDNTIIIVTADHSTSYMHWAPRYHAQQFKIPLLFTGGAVDKIGLNSTYATQSDFTPSLLSQLSIDYDENKFPFGENLFSNNYIQKAYYNTSEGVALLTPNSTEIFDIKKNDYYYTWNIDTTNFSSESKAILQHSYKFYP